MFLSVLCFCFVLFFDAMVTICFIFGGCRCVFSILHSTSCSTPFSFLLSEFVSWINFKLLTNIFVLFLFLSEQLEEKLKEQTAELKKTDVATK